MIRGSGFGVSCFGSCSFVFFLRVSVLSWNAFFSIF